MSEKDRKWRAFYAPDGAPAGVEDSSGRLIAKFNPYDPPDLRRALAKNLIWTSGCIALDAKWKLFSKKEPYLTASEGA